MPDGTSYYGRRKLEDNPPTWFPHKRCMKSAAYEMECDPDVVWMFERFKDKEKHLARLGHCTKNAILRTGPNGDRQPGDHWFLIDQALRLA